MADTKLSALTAATPAAGDLVYLVQGGNSRRATAQGIANLAPGTNLDYDPSTRLLSSSTGGDVTLPLASTTVPGLLSAADKLKLDGGESATVTVAVRNNSGATIAKGVPVYVTGSSGTTVTIAPADASTEATAAQTIGLTQASIAHNADGVVVAVGLLSGINTSALTEGAIVWLSETTGAMTTTRPTQPAHGVVLGYCVKQGAGTAGIVYVKVDNGLELDELHDVLITSPATGQVLRRASDGLWKNAQLAAADLSGLGDLATANAATPPALGGTTPAAGSFSALTASARLGLPSGAPASPVARDLYTVADTLRYRDSTAAERLILNATDNLSNLSNLATARSNLGLGSAATSAATDFLPRTIECVSQAYSATINIDFAANTGKSIIVDTLAGNVAFTFSNISQGRFVTVDLLCDATQRNLTFPAATPFVGPKPSSIAASKAARLTFECARTGTTDASVRAAYAVQT